MRIYVKNIRAKYRPDQIWNDGDLGFLRGRPKKNNNKKNKNNTSRIVRSVPGLKIFTTIQQLSHGGVLCISSLYGYNTCSY